MRTWCWGGSSLWPCSHTGVRQNNASAVRSCPHGAGKPGVAFFLEDEDEWGLQSVLQVSELCCPNHHHHHHVMMLRFLGFCV